MKHCPTCQEEFASKFSFCPVDGTPLMEETDPVDQTPLPLTEQVATPLPAATDSYAANATEDVPASAAAAATSTALVPAGEYHLTFVDDTGLTRRLMGEVNFRDMCALEISGVSWREFGFKDYTVAAYPQFDVSKHVAVRPGGGLFDVVIAEQVMEHVPMPWVAAQSMFRSLNPGGATCVRARS